MAQIAVVADNMMMNKIEKDQFMCSYAALMLHGDGLDITEDKLSQVLRASGHEVESYMLKVFEKTLKDVDITDMIAKNVYAAQAVQAEAVDAVAAEAVVEEERANEDEDDQVEMINIFGEDDDY